MKKSQRRKKSTHGEVSALANDAWSAFLDLVGLALRTGFTLKHQANGAAILEHPVTKATICVGVHAENLPDDAREVLRKFMT